MGKGVNLASLTNCVLYYAPHSLTIPAIDTNVYGTNHALASDANYVNSKFGTTAAIALSIPGLGRGGGGRIRA